MITIENFSEGNRSKTIGNSLYRICKDEHSKMWSVFEIFNEGKGPSMAHDDYSSKNLADVIDRFNNIKSEREITSKLYQEVTMTKVIADGVSGILHSIDYKKKTATVEMDHEYLVEYPWDKILVRR